MKATFQKLLTPGNLKASQARWGILMTLALSMGALLTTLVLMPEGYAWLTHTHTSESAACLARLGFLLLGFAVLRLVAAAYSAWPRGVSWMHLTFGIMMIGTAVYSHRPFIPGVPYDVVEDLLPSVSVARMGFAFFLGLFSKPLDVFVKRQYV